MTDDQYEDLECGLSKNRHFIEIPILLKCGHCVCKNCLAIEPSDYINCNLCKEKTDRKLLNLKECIPVKKNFLRNLGNLSKIVQNRIEKLIAQCIETLEFEDNCIKLAIDYVKEEIEIRIESLKIELDNIHKEFKEKINTYIRVNTETKEMFKEEFLSDVKDIKESLEKNNVVSEQNFYENQFKLQCLNDLILQFNRTLIKPSFSISKDKLKKENVGYINIDNEITNINEKIRNSLKKFDYKAIDLPTRPKDICVLNNGYFLLTYTSEGKLVAFDKNFQVVKIIDKIDGANISPTNVIFDDNFDSIYLIDLIATQIIMLNTDFKKIKSVGSKGSEIFQFDFPTGLACFMDKIYVCDTKNHRIQILTSNLEFLKTRNIDYEPWLIKISNDYTACVSRNDQDGIYFYNLKKKFDLICKYENHGYARISEIKSNFYEVSYSDSKIFCYNTKGDLIEEIITDRLNDILKDSLDGQLALYNEEIIITSYSQKKIARIKLI